MSKYAESRGVNRVKDIPFDKQKGLYLMNNTTGLLKKKKYQTIQVLQKGVFLGAEIPLVGEPLDRAPKLWKMYQTEFPEDTEIIDISIGDRHNLALDSEGRVFFSSKY